MRLNYGKIRIFAEQELAVYLNQKLESAIQIVENETDDYLLNVNEDDYILHISSQAIVEGLEIHEDRIYASSSEKMIPAEHFPRTFNVFAGKSYKKDVIKFHVPFSGNATLLTCMPSTRLMWSIDVDVTNNEFCFEIVNFSDDVESIKRQKDLNMQSIIQQLNYVKTEVNSYNSVINDQVKRSFNARKKRILEKGNVLASLGVPIKKTNDVSPTFSVPAPQTRKKVSISRPVVKEPGYLPEPTLDDKAYFDILTLIHDVGKEFERLPSLYAGKEEEHLRDHFLMMLEPNFQGSATGETFNKSGKTDILLRYDSSNVFIAECKFWTGKKGFLDTISQLLGYLTWRDSKAAVIVFVPNKEFTAVIQTVQESISEHSNYIKLIDSKDETWINYIFHLNDDRNRQVKLAVMLYHTPK